ncbi:MAG: hypothetical protein U0570_06535 [Phycisphaerales bacterium]
MKLHTARLVALAGLLLSTSALAGDAAPAPTPAPAASAPAADLPSAKSLMEKYITAIGGREKLQGVKSRQMTLNMDMPANGMKGTVQVYQAPPAMAYSETEIANIGKFLQGSDGETVWESNIMMGTRILSGKERDNFLRGLRFNADYDYEDTYREMTTTGADKVNDRAVYVVELVTKEGQKETRLFDQETGLLLVSRATMPSQMGDIASETFFSDYREVDGIKMPFKQTVKVMQNEMVTTVEKAALNVEIPASRFELPKEVKDLLEKQKADATKAPAPAPATPAPAEQPK